MMNRVKYRRHRKKLKRDMGLLKKGCLYALSPLHHTWTFIWSRFLGDVREGEYTMYQVDGIGVKDIFMLLDCRLWQGEYLWCHVIKGESVGWFSINGLCPVKVQTLDDSE